MTDEARKIAAGLTEAQRWAVEQIANGRADSPSGFGEAMMDRPGAMGKRREPYKAQGYGRMGGTMMARLERMGLAELRHHDHGHWCPAKARLTALGLAVREVLQEQK